MFSKYPVLEYLRNKFLKNENLSNYHIISVQHILESTGSLFEEFIISGFKPSNIYLTGKIYSTHLPTFEKLNKLGINLTESTYPIKHGMYIEYFEKDIRLMWDKFIKILKPNSNIIILDEGGYTLKNIPKSILGKYPIFGIEQTTSGIRIQNILSIIPLLNLAGSAAKVKIEPHLISDAVNLHLGKLIKKIAPNKIGVVGLGNIGKEIMNALTDKYKLNIYDINKSLQFPKNNNVNRCNSIVELFNESDIIIGATGKDISDISWLCNLNSNKTLISVSSTDIEFNNILRECEEFLINKPSSLLEDLTLQSKNNHTIKIIRGGMVANFTGGPYSVPGNDIQITRGLLMASIIQIIKYNMLLKKQKGLIMLDPYLQSQVVQKWFKSVPDKTKFYSKQTVKGFKNLDWIIENSNGKRI